MKLSARLALLSALCPVALLPAQSNAPEVAPGLHLPGGALPYALDHFEGRPELTPIHHSAIEVNDHKGANVAGSLAGSFFYKPKLTTELAGAHARTILHDPLPSIYLHVNESAETDGETPQSETMVWALVRASVNKDRRIVARVQFTQLTGNAKRSDGAIETSTENLPGGWLKLTPREPLTPGEYAITPVPRTQNVFATVVYDFTLDPAAANAADAVSPQRTP